MVSIAVHGRFTCYGPVARAALLKLIYDPDNHNKGFKYDLMVTDKLHVVAVFLRANICA